MAELDDELYRKMTALTDEGNELQSIGKLAEAKEKFEDAFQFLPVDYHAALEYLRSAMHCPDALGNPFIHLHFGQVQLELGNEKRAQDELLMAYMRDGLEVFEEEDSKYFAFLKTRIKLS